MFTVEYMKGFLTKLKLRRFMDKINNDLNKVYGLMYQYEGKNV